MRLGRHAAGFSLVELLIVITLIVILAGSVTVSIRGAQDGHALQQAAEDLAAAIRFGFEEGRLKGIHHRLVFAEGAASYRLEAATGDVAQPYGPVRGVAGMFRRLPAGIQIIAIDASTGQPADGACTQLPLGSGPDGFEGTIKLCNRQGETITLEIMAGMGHVNVVK